MIRPDITRCLCDGFTNSICSGLRLLCLGGMHQNAASQCRRFSLFSVKVEVLIFYHRGFWVGCRSSQNRGPLRLSHRKGRVLSVLIFYRLRARCSRTVCGFVKAFIACLNQTAKVPFIMVAAMTIKLEFKSSQNVASEIKLKLIRLSKMV